MLFLVCYKGEATLLIGIPLSVLFKKPPILTSGGQTPRSRLGTVLFLVCYKGEATLLIGIPLSVLFKKPQF